MNEIPKSTDLYAAHVLSQQQAWSGSLEAEGFDCAVVHAGTQVVSFLDDHAYPFRPNRHFLAWLPLTHHHDSVLIVRAGERPVLYYHQPEDYWHLPPSDPESWWADHFDVRPVTDPEAWVSYLNGGHTALIGDAPVLRGLQEYGTLNPDRLINRLHLARTRKTAWEIDCIASANLTAARAHRAAEDGFRQGFSELEIHQSYLAAAGQTDEELPYASIVALNEHGAVLHYQQRLRERPAEARSFLIDAGATCHGYAADITRTCSRRQDEFADLVSAMDEVQQQLCNKVRAGHDYRELHLSAHARIAGILASFGIIRVSAETAVESGLSSVFLPHGLGHFIGLQTHDVAGLIADESGEEIPRPEGHPFLRLTRVLEAGNVLTIEPGLYFIEALLEQWRRDGDAAAVNWDKVAELAPFGGIRIEDNVVVTDDEPLNLSRSAFAVLD